jgi:hypothetical protein
MLTDFIKYAMPYISKKERIKIYYPAIKKIEEAACIYHKVSSIPLLKDKIDVAATYNNFKNTTMAEIALEKVLNIKFIDWELKSKSMKSKSILKLTNNEIEIIAVNYGEMPLVYESTKEKIIICYVTDDREVIVAGFANLKIIDVKSSSNKGISTLDKKNVFLSFESLNTFSTIHELQGLVSNK